MKTTKKHINIFSLIIIRMKQLKQKHSQKINLKRILGIENTLLDLKKEKSLKKIKKEDKTIKDVEKSF